MWQGFDPSLTCVAAGGEPMSAGVSSLVQMPCNGSDPMQRWSIPVNPYPTISLCPPGSTKGALELCSKASIMADCTSTINARGCHFSCGPRCNLSAMVAGAAFNVSSPLDVVAGLTAALGCPNVTLSGNQTSNATALVLAAADNCAAHNTLEVFMYDK